MKKFIKACQVGNIKEVRKLLEIGTDYTADDNYAIRWARQNGHKEVVKLLEAQKEIISKNPKKEDGINKKEVIQELLKSLESNIQAIQAIKKLLDK